MESEHDYYISNSFTVFKINSKLLVQFIDFQVQVLLANLSYKPRLNPGYHAQPTLYCDFRYSI